jgi:FAD:protein FMN transferase
VRHVFTTMGTVVSLVADDTTPHAAVADVEMTFARWDSTFSLYRPESELSRIADQRLALTDASTGLREVYEQALEWRTRTRGAFTPHRPDGIVDLSGIVKALAISDAGDVLDRVGTASWSINCGGDILLRQPDTATTTVGLTDPHRPGRLLTAVQLSGARRAIATSGVAERGEHIWGPRTDFDQVTVIADDIVTADVTATAVLAGDADTRDHATDILDIDLLAVHRDGSLAATPGLRLARTRDPLDVPTS